MCLEIKFLSLHLVLIPSLLQMTSAGAITVQRIHSLLFPQFFAGEEHWNAQCAQICGEFDAYDRNPANELLNCAEWLDLIRPLWPSDTVLEDENVQRS
jgi:hypothetical protein